MSSSRSALVISLILLILGLVIGVYQIGLRVEKNRYSRISYGDDVPMTD
jgi:hypothetical protein